jgi:hypothetical protein
MTDLTHEMTLNYYNTDDGIWLVCSCGEAANAGMWPWPSYISDLEKLHLAAVREPESTQTLYGWRWLCALITAAATHWEFSGDGTVLISFMYSEDGLWVWSSRWMRAESRVDPSVLWVEMERSNKTILSDFTSYSFLTYNARNTRKNIVAQLKSDV